MTQNPEVSVVPTREDIAQIVARAYGGSLYPALGTPGDYPTDDVDYRAADAILARLAHQTPPATQPSATVGEVAEACAKIADEHAEPSDQPDEFTEGYTAAARRIAKALRRFATLHTPPPVATATVVDDGARPVGMTIDEARDMLRHNSEHAIIETLRERGLLAATPTPPAGGQ